MEITEVKIKLMGDDDDRLQAFCSITFDGEFVVRDLKIIEGPKGPFIAMPSRKLTAKCIRCSNKNEIRSRYCSGCGKKLPVNGATETKPRLFADIAHPINAACRQKIESAVMQALADERVRSREDGYVCMYDDFDEVLSS